MSFKVIQILQIIVSVLMIGAILMQNRGAGLGGIFGGGGDVYRTKRGAEKLFFTATIVLIIIFAGLAIWGLLIN
jgi:preprotein translocase subunit SecG